MPWVYGEKGMALMKKYFTLRTQLIPYIYTYTWLAHRDSMPLLRPLYLQYPDLDEAYRHAHEYFFGDEILVAPVLDASGDRTVYLPPGEWIDFFSGKHYDGGTTFTAHYAVDRTPVFVREGSIVPEQDVSDYSNQKPLDNIIVNVYGAGKGHFDLYEDDGSTLAYSQNQYAVTPMDYVTQAGDQHELVIEAAKGSFKGQLPSRSYELRIHAGSKPSAITIDGADGAHWKWKANDAVAHWKWDARESTAIVVVPKQSIRERVSVSW
jgi:alpha-glucosidase (family GH31 glycosyl hydrolase)